MGRNNTNYTRPTSAGPWNLNMDLAPRDDNEVLLLVGSTCVVAFWSVYYNKWMSNEYDDPEIPQRMVWGWAKIYMPESRSEE